MSTGNPSGYQPDTVQVNTQDPENDDYDGPYNAKKGEAYLPHRCDEWRIGNSSNVLALIQDLQALMPQLLKLEEEKEKEK